MLKAHGDEGRGVARSRAALERNQRRIERISSSVREEPSSEARAQGELLSMLSHDLRNPLSVILVSTRMLSRNYPPAGQGSGPEPPGRRLVDAITRAAEEINLMLQDFSDAARIGEDRLLISREELDPAALFTQVIAVARPLADSKSIQLSSEFAGELPPLIGDRERLSRVLATLVVNAIKFTPKSGTVALRAERDGDHACFSITDTGPGINPEERPALFTRRSSSRRAVTQGVGIALFAAKGIVEAHGGRIDVESEPGCGSTFYFTLPAATPEELEELSTAEGPVL